VLELPPQQPGGVVRDAAQPLLERLLALARFGGQRRAPRGVRRTVAGLPGAGRTRGALALRRRVALAALRAAARIARIGRGAEPLAGPARAAGSAGLARTALRVLAALLALGLLPSALLEQLLDDLSRLVRVGELGIARERPIVGVEGGLELAGAGQGVAAVVVVAGPVAPEELGRARVIAGPIGGHAAPVRIAERLGRALGATRLQRPMRLLIRAQPQVLPVEGPRLRRGQARQGRDRDHRAPAEREQRQRKQGQHGVGARIAPSLQLPPVGLFGGLHRGRQHALHVAIVQGELGVASPGAPRRGGQALAIEARDHHLAVVVAQTPRPAVAGGDRDRRAGGGADAEDRYRKARVGGVGHPADGIDPVGQQEHAAAPEPRVLQQRAGALDAEIRPAAEDGHDARLQRGQQVLDGAGVVGEGHDGVGIAGVDDEAGEPVAAPRQNVGDAVPGAFQARWRDVLGVHGQGEVQDDDQPVATALQRLWLLAPGRAGQGEHGQEPTQPQRAQPRPPARARRALDEPWRQVGIDHPRPPGVAAAAPVQQPEGEQHGCGRQQPPRPQEVEGGQRVAERAGDAGEVGEVGEVGEGREELAHDAVRSACLARMERMLEAPPCPAARARLSASASASGQWKSSRTGRQVSSGCAMGSSASRMR